MKQSRVCALGVTALLLAPLALGCGEKKGPAVQIDMNAGPPTPGNEKTEKNPLTSGGPETAEQIGRGPGRGAVPEAVRKQFGGDVPQGTPGGPVAPPPGAGGAPK
jgi:hypothetical protein